MLIYLIKEPAAVEQSDYLSYEKKSLGKVKKFQFILNFILIHLFV